VRTSLAVRRPIAWAGASVCGVATSSLKTNQSIVVWPGLVSRRLLQACMTCHSCRWLTRRPSRAQNDCGCRVGLPEHSYGRGADYQAKRQASDFLPTPSPRLRT